MWRNILANTCYNNQPFSS